MVTCRVTFSAFDGLSESVAGFGKHPVKQTLIYSRLLNFAHPR